MVAIMQPLSRFFKNIEVWECPIFDFSVAVVNRGAAHTQPTVFQITVRLLSLITINCPYLRHPTYDLKHLFLFNSLYKQLSYFEQIMQ